MSLLVDGGADPGSFRKDFASGGEEVRFGQIVRTAEPDEGKPVLGQASFVQLAIDHGGKIGQRISAKNNNSSKIIIELPIIIGR
jgi:hypothetical protein